MSSIIEKNILLTLQGKKKKTGAGRHLALNVVFVPRVPGLSTGYCACQKATGDSSCDRVHGSHVGDLD